MFSLVPTIASEMEPMLRLADQLSRCPVAMGRYLPQSMSHLGESEIHNTDKEFRVRIDLQHFKPEEIKITSDSQRVTVHAKHEEKQDEHGYVMRELTRVIRLPENVDAKSVTSTMNSQGILNIKVDKKAVGAPKKTPIPVEFQR